MSTEFVIEQSQRNVVEENCARIENLFNVEISFANGTAGKLWITLTGGQLEKAKSYVQALASPEAQRDVNIPPSLVKTVGPRTNEHSKVESEYGVVVEFPKDTTARIAGSQMDVIMAESYLDELIKKRLSGPQPKPRTKLPEPKPNRALVDFALKLGYKQEKIDAVFDKLGPSIDQDTFLKELVIGTGAQQSKVPDYPLLNPPMRTTGTTRATPVDTWHPSERIGQELVVSRGMRRQPISNSNLDFDSGNVYGAVGTCGVVSKGVVYPYQVSNSNNVISRGIRFPTRTMAQTTQGNTTTYSDMERSQYSDQFGRVMHSDLHPQNSQNDQFLEQDQLLEQLLTRKHKQSQSVLRHIVIDGSNVAMSHGNNKVFSCRGIALCVEWFRKRGHTEITVFVPQWRKESPKIDNPIADQHILNQLEAQGYLTFTPSRRINGRRIVCYDDRFIVRLADSNDGVIVSNDNFKDLASENPKWRDVIEQRLLMYSFVNDMFMPPDDPLGRHGPTLDEFLHKGTPTYRRVCPYGRRCTFGTRCKFHHPEREMQLYQNLKQLFPSQDALIVSVMRKYPQEKDADKLATHILNLMH